MERAAFRDYFTSTITKELKSDPEKDATTITVGLKLSTLKLIYATGTTNIYNHFQGAGAGCQTILNGWKAAGIVEAVEDARNETVVNLNPFA